MSMLKGKKGGCRLYVSGAQFLSVIPRIVFKSALGSWGSALAVESISKLLLSRVWRGGVEKVPPDAALGWSWECVFAHSALACLINDSLLLYAFCSACAFSRADIDNWV